jgi:predicted phosphoadenosine phosphosulfate sulfurtransferase
MTRRRAVRRRKGDNYIIPFNEGSSQGNVWKAYPVYDWSTEDVWTAPKLMGWDYNHCYDHMEMMGIPHHSQRCSPPFGEEPLGGLHMWAECFPDVWDKMVERVPGVGAALRYARTELWAYGGLPEKPHGMPWIDFILNYIKKFDPAVQPMIAKRITDSITVHSRKTTLPITVTTRHPVSGVSWNYLLKIAMRGDFKQRNPPVMGLRIDEQGRTVASQWHKYVKEIRDLLESGEFADLTYPGRLPADLDSIIPDYAKDLTK